MHKAINWLQEKRTVYISCQTTLTIRLLTHKSLPLEYRRALSLFAFVRRRTGSSPNEKIKLRWAVAAVEFFNEKLRCAATARR